MRLVKSVERLEAAAAGRAAAPGSIGMCWTRREERVDAYALQEGEYIAADVWIDDGDFWTIKERVTVNAADLGVVRNMSGGRLGYVVKLDGSLIQWRPDAGVGELPRVGPPVPAEGEA
jgi:hypothetical protein